ncbi:MAG: hypothetical protein GYA55_00280 [SAR324 cluster bacterium]|uniref:Uncharacterized protein n=1 Tax=SAR324 cluster bacterium TaxID=2024889 RepID=A0A7X9FNW6_9DELT|nr:hypothetical protein [SAR324 cluster bacterium]
MTTSVNTIGRAQYLREFGDSLNRTDHFQEVGGTVGGMLSDCERELMEAYSAVGTLKPPSRTDDQGRVLSPEEIKEKEKEYEQKLKESEANIQKLNIRYKRLQNIMDLFQTVVKNHYEMVQRMIANLSIRG